MNKLDTPYRSPKVNSVFSSLKMPILSYLLDNLTLKECFECKRVNICLLNAFHYHIYHKWPLELKELQSQYNLLISEDQIDQSRLQAVSLNRSYQMADSDGKYVQVLLQGERVYSLFNAISFDWCDDQRYWSKIAFNSSLFGGPSYVLKMVCWSNQKISIPHVKPGNYNLFIRHGVVFIPRDALNLTVFVDSEKIHFMSYPTAEMIETFKGENKLENKFYSYNWMDNYPNPNLIDSFLFNIRKNNFNIKEEGNDYQISVHFLTVNNNWKKGWILDAIYLEPDR